MFFFIIFYLEVFGFFGIFGRCLVMLVEIFKLCLVISIWEKSRFLNRKEYDFFRCMFFCSGLFFFI